MVIKAIYTLTKGEKERLINNTKQHITTNLREFQLEDGVSGFLTFAALKVEFDGPNDKKIKKEAEALKIFSHEITASEEEAAVTDEFDEIISDAELESMVAEMETIDDQLLDPLENESYNYWLAIRTEKYGLIYADSYAVLNEEALQKTWYITTKDRTYCIELQEEA